jgi:D-glycero-beta-D-manno-heptose 1-phosphate adenylyltransferase
MEVENKIASGYKELKEKVLAHKILGRKVVCTIGSWDMLHIGHVRYLNTAKKQGDVLIVGVDTDRGVKLYKGPLRPIIPENERMEMLSYQDCVDYVIPIDDIDKKGNWTYKLIKQIPIDVFVAVDDNSYTFAQLKIIRKYCRRLFMVPRQAKKTSSTDIIQNVLKSHLTKDINELRKKKFK